jgi:hypothetical protein
MPVTILNTGTFNGGTIAPTAKASAAGLAATVSTSGTPAGLASASAAVTSASAFGLVRHVGATLGSGTAGDMTPAAFQAIVGSGNLGMLYFFLGSSIPASLSAAPYSIASYAGVYRVQMDFELTHYGYSNGVYGSGGTPAAGAVTDLGNLQTFLQSCQAGGLDARVCLWHEPYNKFNLGTQAQNNLDYTNSIGYYGAMLRTLGIPVKFSPSNYSANSSYGHWAQTIGNAAAPGLGYAAASAGYLDEIVTDMYVNEDGGAAGSGVQGELNDVWNLANAFSLPFGMNEYGYAPAVTTGNPYNQADVNAFNTYVMNYLQNLLSNGYPLTDIIVWATNDNATTAGMYLASNWSATSIAHYQTLFADFDGGAY